jgi:acetylornithine/succinyldiaminopimelate/putrescine aminotransferase
VIERDKLLAHVRDAGQTWLKALSQLPKDFPGKVGAIRGLGFLIGIQMTSETPPTVAALREKGLLTAPAGGNVIRLLPPLITPAAELAESVEIFRSVLA